MQLSTSGQKPSPVQHSPASRQRFHFETAASAPPPASSAARAWAVDPRPLACRGLGCVQAAWPLRRPFSRVTAPGFHLLQAPRHPVLRRGSPSGNTKAGSELHPQEQATCCGEIPSSAATPDPGREFGHFSPQGFEQTSGGREAARHRTPGKWTADPPSAPEPPARPPRRRASTGKPWAPAASSSTPTLGQPGPRPPPPGSRRPHLRTARGAAGAPGRLAAAPASAGRCSSRRPPRGAGPPPPSPPPGRRPCCRRGRGAARGARGRRRGGLRSERVAQPPEPQLNRRRRRRKWESELRLSETALRRQ